jgi:hypothetical protein
MGLYFQCYFFNYQKSARWALLNLPENIYALEEQYINKNSP